MIIHVSLLLRRKVGEIRAVFTRFCRFLNGAVGRKSPICTGKNDQFKRGEVLNLADNIICETKQFSIALL